MRKLKAKLCIAFVHILRYILKEVGKKEVTAIYDIESVQALYSNTLITAYYPAPAYWEKDNKTRKVVE